MWTIKRKERWREKARCEGCATFHKILVEVEEKEEFGLRLGKLKLNGCLN